MWLDIRQNSIYDAFFNSDGNQNRYEKRSYTGAFYNILKINDISNCLDF